VPLLYQNTAHERGQTFLVLHDQNMHRSPFF
jgi:hypothetical protein